MTSCLANIHTFTRIGQFIGNSVTVPLANCGEFV